MMELVWNVSGPPEPGPLLLTLSAGLSSKPEQLGAPLVDKLSLHVIHPLNSNDRTVKLKYGASKGRVISFKLSCQAISPLTTGDGKTLEKNAETKGNEYIRKIACCLGVSALFGGRRDFPFNAEKGEDL